MKRHIYLVAIIFVMSGINVYSQTLYNTKWMVCDTNINFITYFLFGSDTLFLSADNKSYAPICTYQESDDNVAFIDLPGSDCPIIETGKYTFLIQNDALLFTLINDTCSTRKNILINYRWIKFTTGIHTVNPLMTIQLFPNPSNGIFSIKTETLQELGKRIEIVNMLGEKLYSSEITSNKTDIDLSYVSKGIYFLKIFREKGIYKTYKIIIK